MLIAVVTVSGRAGHVDRDSPKPIPRRLHRTPRPEPRRAEAQGGTLEEKLLELNATGELHTMTSLKLNSPELSYSWP